MMRSLFSGVSGLQNHQVRMDVIGNNIANVNTVGFKSSRATFKEALSQTLSSASAPQNDRGGINAQQIGLGVGIGSIDVLHTQGGTQSTTSETDVSIEGIGFLVVGDGNQQYYTRAGMLEFDGSGTLVSKTNGMKVMGYMADDSGKIIDAGGQLNAMEITTDMGTYNPQATENVIIEGNISAHTDFGDSVSRIATVYDSLGATHRVIISFTKDNLNSWTWSASLEDDPENELNTGEIYFNEEGNIDDVVGTGVTIPRASLPPGEAYDLTFDLNFDGINQFAEDNSLVIRSQDGLPKGDLDGITIDQSGILVGTYSNGLIRQLGQIAMARFENPPGLLKVGDTMFAESVNSGDPIIGLANTGGFGSIKSNSLEMSNVDLSQEFTEMIITQRGFQANSRIITSADEMLQELVNLKR